LANATLCRTVSRLATPILDDHATAAPATSPDQLQPWDGNACLNNAPSAPVRTKQRDGGAQPETTPVNAWRRLETSSSDIKLLASAMTELGTLGGTSIQARSVNGRRQVVGESRSAALMKDARRGRAAAT